MPERSTVSVLQGLVSGSCFFICSRFCIRLPMDELVPERLVLLVKACLTFVMCETHSLLLERRGEEPDFPRGEFNLHLSLVHSAAVCTGERSELLFGDLADQCFRSQHESGDGGGVLEGEADDLGGVD